MSTRSKRDWPYWAYSTRREWKASARKRVTAALKALDEARGGCAFYPDGPYEAARTTISKAEAALKHLRHRMSEKEWGR